MEALLKFPGLAKSEPSTKCSDFGRGGRPKNRAVRAREHLTPDEVERMIASAGRLGRYPNRDALLIMMAYRHGLRASELAGKQALRWDQVTFGKAACLHVGRLKNGSASTHPLHGPEIKLLHTWRHEQESLPKQSGAYIFSAERGGPMSRVNVYQVVARAGKATGIEFPVHPHMLRHATGFYLANAGQDTRAIQLYLGHKNIQHTVRYTELSPHRFKDFWKD
jgi:type 1 fimbriae regulatory protein FimB/type 1 fimbriae regulatory protein FimE